ncbi:MAG: S8 family serine peptidase [Candidatus Kapaibacterium sp.]
MVIRYAFLLCSLLFTYSTVFSQQWIKIGEQLQKVADNTTKAQKQYEQQHNEALAFAKTYNIPTDMQIPNGPFISLQRIENGMPMYYFGISVTSATTIRSNTVWTGGSLGLNLNGSGQTLGIWDEARVRNTHQELTGRITQVDNPANISNHATHCAGTMIASGVSANAKGMSPAALIKAHDWNSDESEMRTAAGLGMKASNHSYGYLTGWVYNLRGDGKWGWMGDVNISSTSDYRFGFYTSLAQSWDNVARDYPNYLICKAAGNDRGEGVAAGTEHWVWQNGAWALSTTTRNYDGGTSGYDCIEGAGLAKNVLTVGAVNAVSNYTGPSSVVMSSFSGFGPTDDGRIKPDIVAMGVSELSSVGSADNAYAYYSGTSMATPAVTGSIALLCQHHTNLKPTASPMKSSTVKGLIIHTADEAGANPGPDYKFGWGLMNTGRAAQVMSANANRSANWEIQELTLQNGQVIEIPALKVGTEPIKVTISWTDPAGTPVSASLNPTTSMLKNDVDLRLLKSTTTYQPWVLNPSAPDNAATNSDNTRDNVEQVYIAQPTEGSYTIRLSHKGTLTGGTQVVSVIISGLVPPTLVVNAGTDKYSCAGSAVTLNGTTVGSGTLSYAWFIAGTTTQVGNTASISVTPSQTTTYRLVVTNGQDTATDDVIVTLAENPSVNGGTDKTITAGQTATLSVVNPNTALQYEWRDLSTNSTVGTTASITVQPFSTRNYTVTARNSTTGCTSNDTVLVTVNPVNVTANAGADKYICQGVSVTVQGSGTGAGTLQYQWKDMASNTIVSTVAYFTQSPTSTRDYVLRVTDQAGSVGYDTVKVNVFESSWKPSVTANGNPCKGSTVTYTVPVLQGVSYVWSCVSGTIKSGSTTYSVTIQWGTSQAQGIVVCTATIGNCQRIRRDTMALLSLPTPQFTVANTCVGETKTYTTSATTGSTYLWTLPNNNGTIISGASTNTVTINWASTGTKTVSIKETNASGCIGTTTKNLVVNPLPTPTITVNNSTAPKVGQTRMYSIPNSSTSGNGRAYQWVASGGTIVSGQGSRSVYVTWNNPGAGSVTVTETITSTGCSKSATMNVTVTQGFGLDDAEDIVQLNVYPNPAQQYIMIELPIHDKTIPLHVDIADAEGRIVAQWVEVPLQDSYYKSSFNIAHLVTGLYIVRIHGGDVNVTSRFLKE